MTAFGTGVGLANNPTYWIAEKYKVTYGQFNVHEVDSPVQLTNAQALTLALKDLIKANNFSVGSLNPFGGSTKKLLEEVQVSGSPLPFRIVSHKPVPNALPAPGVAGVQNGDGTWTYTITFNQAHEVIVTNIPPGVAQ